MEKSYGSTRDWSLDKGGVPGLKGKNTPLVVDTPPVDDRGGYIASSVAVQRPMKTNIQVRTEDEIK